METMQRSCMNWHEKTWSHSIMHALGSGTKRRRVLTGSWFILQWQSVDHAKRGLLQSGIGHRINLLALQNSNSQWIQMMIAQFVTCILCFRVGCSYSIQIAKQYQNKGLGHVLMSFAEDLAIFCGLEKCRLTVFKVILLTIFNLAQRKSVQLLSQQMWLQY